MSATFLDTQDESNPLNGSALRDASAAGQLLSGLQGRPPFFFMLQGRGDRNLLVGLGRGVGCAQFTDAEGVARIAVSPRPTAQSAEFLTGDTPTPVEGRHLLPVSLLQRIVAYFIDHSDRSQEISWELV